MHILVVSHSCCISINQQIYAEIQRQTGWRFTLVVPDSWRDEFGNVVRAEPWPGFEVDLRHIPVWQSGNIIFHVYRTRWQALLREVNPDLIYMNHEPYALATAQLCRANESSIRIPLGFYSCQNIVKHYPPPFSWLERMVYRHASFALPITNNVASVLKKKGYQSRVAVCALPLDPELYHPGLRNKRPPSLHFSDRKPLIGYVGRAVESKGLRTLAAALVMLKDLEWNFVLVGTGDLLGEFQELITKAGLTDRLQCAGYIPHTETPCWLAAMDVLLVPSETQPNWKEQFGRVIPEALACGTPVIGSDSGEIPNLITQSGGGLIFPERNAEALAQGLRTLLASPETRAQMAMSGRSWVEREIALPSVAGRMIDVLRSSQAVRKR